ncbi:sn-glycerol-3-phosphate-binding periplasmic protein UgpB precursor [Corynebacterium kalinowskii]|uniref:Sn-glycerol-3-phosphate-binding periplasmic protein UgpB n=1 Tax=Corynebacterium kalinowskii TaxID=2675216 RepID=A0A6B8W169_9CORY|nr:ABC transporter substrate-binding protein [Corynebacterium kalinowskii]QGU01438.1 sn-glycerol-3-phosphate-binding periplasmic protein UgpB precursor [Corynebacterium kalinowskii]
MKRRNFLALAGIGAAGATLAACAGTSSTSTDSKKSDGGKVTELTWWSNHPGKSKDIETELIKRFNEKNPDIKINLIDGGKNYEELAQKFNAALTGSDLPDIIVLSDVWWFNFAINGQIAKMNELAKKANIDTASYVPSLYADYELNGANYAFPFARSTPLFYYNKDVWAKAGLPERGPETWEEMDEWGKKIMAVVEGKTKAHGWGNATDYLAWTFEGPMWTMGGAYSDKWDLKFNTPETVKSVEWLKSTVVGPDAYATVSQEISADFSAGLVASAIMSTGDLSGLKKNGKVNFGTSPLPNPKGDGGCPTGGAGLAIPSGISEERQIAAAKFIDFITNAANTAYWSRNVGYMPVRTTAQEDAEQKKFMAENPNYKTAVDQLPQTRSQDYARVFIPGADTKIGGAFESILIGNKDPKEEMDKLQKEVQSIYDAQVKPQLKK